MQNPKPRQKQPAKSCGTCRYLNPTTNDAGECRRWPPRAITKFEGADEFIRDRFPGVRKADIWCGEWAK